MKAKPDLRRILILLILAVGMAGLAGCGGSNVRPSPGEIAAQGPFGMIIEAYKGGQYIVDGGVVAAQDLGGHLAFLQDQGKMPEKVLLENSSESKVSGEHLRQFTQLQAKYGFQAYVEHKGKIEPLHPEQ
ncbi:MAG: hypothetical protein WBW92_10650 [Rhodanobacteraceae bacterium]